VYTIPGTSSKGRRPTPYEREVYSQVTNTNAEWYWYSVYGHQYKVNTPLSTVDFINSMTQHKARPFIAPGGDPYRNVDFANALSRAITECLVKIGGNKVDTGTALAELGKTTSHLAQTGKDIWGSISALRGRRWSELLGILSKRSKYSPKINPGMTAARYWLEYNYAWKPLFNEAYGLYELLTEQLKPALLVHASRTISWPFEFHDVRLKGANWYNQSGSYSGKVKTESTVRLTGRIDNDFLRTASAGFTNPAAIAWELVPYSFVIDWSLPIGNYLQAATATQGLAFVWGSSTQRYQAFGKARIFCDGDPNDIWNFRTVVEGSAEMFKFGMQRVPLSGWPSPVLYAKSPLSSSHALSALALLRTLF
jgi:hypothetical protein